MTREQLYAALKRASEDGDDATELVEEWLNRFPNDNVPWGTYRVSRTLVLTT